MCVQGGGRSNLAQLMIFSLYNTISAFVLPALCAQTSDNAAGHNEGWDQAVSLPPVFQWNLDCTQRPYFVPYLVLWTPPTYPGRQLCDQFALFWRDCNSRFWKSRWPKKWPSEFVIEEDPSRAGRVNRWYTTRHLKLAEWSTSKFSAPFPPFCLPGSPKYNEQGAFQFLKSTLPHQWLLSLGSPSGGFGQGGWKFTFWRWSFSRDLTWVGPCWDPKQDIPPNEMAGVAYTGL